ncbi:globin domain-containing protein [Kitasatospora sp. MAP5-34]|uniref:globin domain-containing protein n=1 Tax=Kitasatospora sp. MAP5-34 TaxID=3035102 RepID=UPI002475D6C6|nr:globin domain-containing protein [Kitasatospora sp. MAP5-34]MDH6576285.1 hemoglobin-like flavoprotein [Kitasatospora sp. MAP5-34]
MTIDPVLIKSSFAVVEPHGPEVAARFYRHLFEHNPGVRSLFAEHLDGQQDRLWAALGALVTRLEDTDALLALLRDLGRRHAGYGTLPAHFPAVGASLIATLRHFAGAAWTPATEDSWQAVYGTVAATMTQALTEALSGAGPAAAAAG